MAIRLGASLPAVVTAVIAMAAIGMLACGDDAELVPPEGALEIGAFYVIEDDGLEFDEIATVCEAETVDDGSLLVDSPFESRRFPDWTRVFRCKDDGHVTAAVVRSSPGFRRYEFTGLPVVEWGSASESEFSTLEIEGMMAVIAEQIVPGVVGHSAAIYVIEEFPDGEVPGRMAELRYTSPGRAVCFMRQILDLDAPGPCED